jgi:hypothetical protein
VQLAEIHTVVVSMKPESMVEAAAALEAMVPSLYQLGDEGLLAVSARIQSLMDAVEHGSRLLGTLLESGPVNGTGYTATGEPGILGGTAEGVASCPTY